LRRGPLFTVVLLCLMAALGGVALAKTHRSTPVLLGDRSLGSFTDHAVAGKADVFRFVAKTTGTASSMRVFIGSGNSASSAVVGLYSNAAGRPHNLLAKGSRTGLTAGRWNRFSISAAQVVAGKAYWIAVLAKSRRIAYRGVSRVNLRSLPRLWRSGSMALATRAPSAPVNTALPVISGTAAQGDRLKVSQGSWSVRPASSHYRWQVCNEVGTACTQISGAASSSYVVASGDVGHTIRVRVAVTKASRSAHATSAATAVVPASPAAPLGSLLAPPVNTALPAISGTAAVGDTLSASTGSWSGSPLYYLYLWQDCNASGSACAYVSSAWSGTYVVASGDVGHSIRVTVGALGLGGWATAMSAPTSVVPGSTPDAPVNTALPSISGTAAVGDTLSASKGSWSNSPTGYTYAWSKCNSGGCSSITGVSASSYTVASSEVGDTIEVILTAQNSGGSTKARSAPTAVVPTPPVPAPVNMGSPSISGTAAVGDTLSASKGSWSNSPTGYTYAWSKCNSGGCSALTGATASTYPVSSSDEGNTIEVAVTAKNAGGSTSATSDPTAVVPTPPVPAPVNTALPSISGTAAVGDSLSASNGSWSNSPTGYTYAWSKCNSGGCSALTGATASTYPVSSSDEGHTIEVVVTAKNSGGSTSATSDPTAVVPTPPVPAPVNTALPSISGTAAVGDSLSASNGSWSNSPTGYTYAWSDCNSAGAGCTSITGATSSSYPVASSDAGSTIEVVVTAKNAGGSTSATSAPTGVVPAPAGGPGGLYVHGSELVNASGAVVHLHGVNRSGTEYSCVQNDGFFDGPSDAASVAAMAAWNINIVRVPLNEDCWLGINGVNPAYAGQNYINAIVNYVNLLHSYGMYAELSLIWAAPGSASANYQSAAPDEDHSPAMWASLAATFKNDPNVILAPWGETYLNWADFMGGSDNAATYSSADGPFDGDGSCGTNCDYYTTAGMDQAVTVMRGAGYSGPIAIPCIDYANTCADPTSGGDYSGSTWIKSHPTDPDNQLIAEVHIYGGQLCATAACLNVSVAPILAAGYPVIFGETGEEYTGSDCGSSAISTFMDWADANDVGYEAWAWDTNEGCDSLVSNYNGTPDNAYGTWVYDHYLELGHS